MSAGLPEKLMESLKKSTEEQKVQKETKVLAFHNLFEEMKKATPEDNIFEEIENLLGLPDESFDLIKPIVLSEIEREYNNINDEMLIVQAINAAGLKAEDLEMEYDQICAEIDKNISDVFSNTKRDFLKQILGVSINAINNIKGIAKRTMFVPIEYCHPDAKMPTYAHTTDSGMDLYTLEDIDIKPGETKLIATGIKVAIPLGYELQVRPKSGRSLKSKLRIANTPGTIDAGYRDEIKVIAENTDQFIRNAQLNSDGSLTNVEFGSSIHIGKGEKFAQLVLAEVPKAAFYKVESVSTVGEDRGGGFGSTGNK